eukprot:TRINITY_DN2330_c0_g1_i5.p1 TRINITY_DN2330_c0_g1~~TRINITY_DN2330_c0_g1_i5.p1  ORF type:complete len:577 (+),score=113.88 TRINITY_DN2330_c0_g1_i5:234-1964(+)
MAQDEDSFVKADEEVRKTSEDVAPNSGTTTGRQRKKRKWDQPAESLVSAGLVIPGAQHYAVPGITGSGASVSGFVPAVTIPTSFVSTPHLQPSAVQHTAVAIVQKINQDLATKGLLAQPKIQDEVIAREIVINDADPTVRYKLTKRQTQEEIQAKTGAVVITRGKYRPPNGPIENEKPLYLHISSGAHLKDLAERIRAVDLAALMVEEIMKQGRLMPATSNVHSLVGQGTTPCSISVFVGVEADPTFNLVGRIRGPNDQYINHIMNETGATVILRGRGSGSCEGANDEEAQQPLHLFISSDNVKNLENAKALADSLLETVRSEYFASRSLPYQVASTIPTADLVAPTPLYQAASYSTSTPYAGLYPQAVVSYSHIPPNTFSPTSSIPQRPSINSNPVVSTGSFNSATKAYNAVPPPLHLLSETTVGRTETQKTDSVSKDLNPQGSTSSSTLFPCQPAPISSTLQNINDSKSVASVVASEIPITHQSKAGTNYSGYGGIYPQATPLQQVALALQRPPPPVSIQPASANGQPTKAHLCHSNGQSDKHPEKRRKFQEMPVASKDHPKEAQVFFSDLLTS